jgi:hypothetical protein
MARARLRHFVAAAVLLAVAAVPAVAGCDKPAPIHFAPGASAADLTGGLARGDRDCFTIGARTGQLMTVTQTDRGEGNIVLQLYRPPWRTVPSPDGPVVLGTALKGTEEGRDAAEWSGRLPATGPYLLVLGTSRGGGEYAVHVEVR